MNDTTENAYDAYKNSLGLRIKLHRDERKMTLKEVAEALTETLNADGVISAMQIQHWEQSRALPDKQQLEALAIALIDENDAVIDKEQARKVLLEAYAHSTQAFELDERSDDLYAFADALIYQRENLKDSNHMTLSLEGLAQRASEHVKINIGDREKQLLATEPFAFIAGIEAGVIIPSKGLMHALVTAMHSVMALEPEQKKALYDAHERIAENKPRAAFVPKVIEGGLGTQTQHSESEPLSNEAHATEQNETEALSPRLLGLKQEMNRLFTFDDGKFKASVIAGETGISHTALSALMGIKCKQNPKHCGSLSGNVKAKLRTYLEAHGKEDMVEEFEAIFDDMRAEVGYKKSIVKTSDAQAARG